MEGSWAQAELLPGLPACWGLRGTILAPLGLYLEALFIILVTKNSEAGGGALSWQTGAVLIMELQGGGCPSAEGGARGRGPGGGGTGARPGKGVSAQGEAGRQDQSGVTGLGPGRAGVRAPCGREWPSGTGTSQLVEEARTLTWVASKLPGIQPTTFSAPWLVLS